MAGDEEERLHQELWKSQRDDEAMTITSEDICARARFCEKEGVWIFRTVMALTVAAVVGCRYQMSRLHNNGWLMLTMAVLLGGWCRFAWEFRKGPTRRGAAEPCADFLRRKRDEKRQGHSWLRRAPIWIGTLMILAWLGGGPMEAAKNLGIRSARVLAFIAGPEYLIFVGLVLGLYWGMVRLVIWDSTRKHER